MRTRHSSAGQGTAHPPLPRIAPADYRQPSMLIVSLAAGLAVTLSCTDAPMAPRNVRRGVPIMLNATAAAAVRTVLADIAFRIGDAIEDDETRTSFAKALLALTGSLDAGLLDDATQFATNARAALTQAASLDADGTGDADRSAISLALDITDDEITNARLAAGGQ